MTNNKLEKELFIVLNIFGMPSKSLSNALDQILFYIFIRTSSVGKTFTAIHSNYSLFVTPVCLLWSLFDLS